jgi:hypothetical protein
MMLFYFPPVNKTPPLAYGGGTRRGRAMAQADNAQVRQRQAENHPAVGRFANIQHSGYGGNRGGLI